MKQTGRCQEFDAAAGTAKITASGETAKYEFTAPGAITADGKVMFVLQATSTSVKGNRLSAGIGVAGNVTFTGATSVQAFAEDGAEKTERVEPTMLPSTGTTEIKLTPLDIPSSTSHGGV